MPGGSFEKDQPPYRPQSQHPTPTSTQQSVINHREHRRHTVLHHAAHSPKQARHSRTGGVDVTDTQLSATEIAAINNNNGDCESVNGGEADGVGQDTQERRAPFCRIGCTAGLDYLHST